MGFRRVDNQNPKKKYDYDSKDSQEGVRFDRLKESIKEKLFPHLGPQSFAFITGLAVSTGLIHLDQVEEWILFMPTLSATFIEFRKTESISAIIYPILSGFLGILAPDIIQGIVDQIQVNLPSDQPEQNPLSIPANIPDIDINAIKTQEGFMQQVRILQSFMSELSQEHKNWYVRELAKKISTLSSAGIITIYSSVLGLRLLKNTVQEWFKYNKLQFPLQVRKPWTKI